LVVVRTLVRAKSFSLRNLKIIGRPFLVVGRIILPRLIVPLYHSLYLIRRRLDHWYRPAKNKFMYALANRHMLHVVVVVIALVAGLVNFQLSTVRAETYGERSLMYGLVTHNEQQLIDEYADATRTTQSAPVKYLAGSTLMPSRSANALEEEHQLSGSSVIGSSSLSALAIANGSASVAPREVIETYIVSSGDTLSTIASSYGISLNTLLWANNLTTRSLVKPGQTLTILPVSGVAHTVKKGDTLAQISKKYGVDQGKILSYNKLAGDSTLSVGQQVLIPGGVVQPVAAKPAVSRVLTATPSKTTPSTTRNAGATMLWPTDLSYIVRGLSWSHSGLDIDCNGHSNGSSSNDNYAAAAGTVSYSGWRNGYGNTVEIQHANGLMTRYGHHYSLYVKTGQVVSAGTPIGRCGSTGTSTGTHLHFEVIGTGGRKDFRNPLEYIR
jgi:murein DD-endopeptidase MepM/ murein hydrolase activator NlpD